MRQRARIALPAAAAVCALAGLPAWAATSGATGPAVKVLSRDMLPATVLTHPVGTPSPTAHWHVGVSVQGRNPGGLAALAKAQYDKASPLYRHFLTPGDYAAQFGADPTAAGEVRSWLTSKGLAVTYANEARTYFEVEGNVAQVEKTFRVTLVNYRAGTTSFTANTTAPTVPTAVTAVAGLDTLSTRATTATVTPKDFPIPSTTTPKDLWSVYEQPSDNTGQGEKLAAFGWGAPGSVATDLTQFETENGLPQIPFNVVQVGTPNTTDTSGLLEWDLDSQASSGMAPDTAGMTFYFANAGNSDLLAASINTWADDPNGAKQASGSYGLCDVFGFLGVFDAHEAALTQAAAEGRTFFASTGDNGSGCSAVVNTNGITIGPVPSQEYPATSPHAVAVGGTVLYTTGSPAQRDQEIAWTHGGGGPSYTYAAPDWQASQPLATEGRAVADVAAQSGDLLSGYNIVSAGSDTIESGTSLSAPLWQGMWARVNAAGPAGTDGVANLGFADPLIYANNADATKYADSFTDITVGANGLYPTLPGYDYPTGWGAPRVTGLALSLAGKTTPTNAGSGGTTGGGTPPPPPPPLAECQPAPQVVDARGDATQAVVVDTGASPASRGDLDIVDYGITWDNTAAAVTATLHVADLAAEPSTGENYRLAFNHDGTNYEIQASRDVSGATSFTWDVPGVNASSLGDLTGSFDPTKNAITVVLTAAQYAAAQPANAPLAAGQNVNTLSALAQQLAGTTQTGGATLTADDAATASPCQVTFTAPATPTTTCPPKKGKPSPDCKKH